MTGREAKVDVDLMRGREERDAVLALLERTRSEYLERARAAAEELAKKTRTVTIDDVRAVCPPPAGIDPRVLGSVFMKSRWVPVGFAQSARATCHARHVRVFVRKEDING
jgi:hypothetical protein